MHAFLIVGGNDKLTSPEVQKILKTYKYTKTQNYNIAKIEDVRNLRDLLKFSYSERTLIRIDNFHLASEEAQNSFLKNLEEPQENIGFLLTANSKEVILDTIVSRCRVIFTIEPTWDLETLEFVRNFISLDKKERLIYVWKIKDRAEAMEFLLKIIKGGQHLLIEDKRYYNIVDLASKTLRRINKNANVRLNLMKFIIAINRSSLLNL